MTCIAGTDWFRFEKADGKFTFKNFERGISIEKRNLDEAIKFQASIEEPENKEKVAFKLEIVDHEPATDFEDIFKKDTVFGVKITYTKRRKSHNRLNFSILQGTVEELEFKVLPYDIYEEIMKYADKKHSKPKKEVFELEPSFELTKPPPLKHSLKF